MGRFDDAVVWITGGGSGIGRACATAFAAEGAKVVVSGRRADRLEAVAAEVGGLAVPCDVTDDASIADAVGQVVGEHGRLDVTVCNAGYAVSDDFSSLTRDDWRRQFEVNVFGLAECARAALPHLLETKGRLALVGSIAGFVCAPKLAPYNASKFAVRAIGWTLAAELRDTGVSCTTVHPGYVASEIAQVDNSGHHDPERRDRRPAKLMWPADKAARTIVRAIHGRKRDYVFTGHGRFAAWLGRHAPGMAFRLVAR